MTGHAPHPMDDDIEIHFDEKRGHLTLTCGDDAFARIREDVCAEAGIGEFPGLSPAGIRYIEIESVVEAPQGGRGQVLVWVGCTMISGALLFVLSVGVATVFRWLMGRFG